LALKLTGMASIAALHQAPAKDYADWGNHGRTLDLRQLAQSMPSLADIAEQSWPFLRTGVSELIKPSLGAKEAVHPLGIAEPSVLEGLQLHGQMFRARRVTEHGWFVVTSNGHESRAVRSRDSGRKWTRTSPWQTALQGTSDRCSCDGGDRAFGLESNRSGLGPSIVYYDHDSRTGQSVLGGPHHQVKSLGCDENAAVVLTDTSQGELGIWLCVPGQSCKPLPTPPIFREISADGLDVARLRGAIVVAVTQGSVVRVVSTRDDGRSYTPFTIALDHGDNLATDRSGHFPAQLLAVAGSVLIIEEASTSASPTLALVSDDLGASWHAWHNTIGNPSGR
jgi:hypothetical protein